MDINGNFDWGDLPNFINPNFGYEIGESIYREMERLGIPEDEFFNPTKRALAKLKIDIFNIAQQIRYAETTLSGDIKQLEYLTGKPLSTTEGQLFISGIETIVLQVMQAGVVSAATATTALSTIATVNPIFAAFFLVVNLLDGFVIKGRIEEYTTRVKNDVEQLKSLTNELRRLINLLPEQKEPVTENVPKPPVNSANTDNEKIAYWALGFLGLFILYKYIQNMS